MRSLDLANAAFLDAGSQRDSTRQFGWILSELERYRSLGVFTFKPIVAAAPSGELMNIYFQESDPPVMTHSNLYDGVDDGSLKLRDGANSNIYVAIPFTQDNVDYRTPIAMSVMVSRVGTPVNTASDRPPNISFSIIADVGGNPDPGLTSLGDSYKLATADISTSLQEILIGWEGINVDIAKTTQYWLVIEGEYDEDASNCIQIHYNTVVGTSDCRYYDTSWNAMASEDVWFKLFQLTFEDVSGDEIDEGGNIPAWQSDILPVNSLDTLTVRTLNLMQRKSYIRVRYEFSNVPSGLWFPFIIGVVGDAIDPPVLPIS